MQKSTKRLLSMLAVLALVLTMAPAGILAVETKAAAGDANLPTGVADTMAAGKAKQAAAVAALDALTGTTEAERLAELNTNLTVCPFCGVTVKADGTGWRSFGYSDSNPNQIKGNYMSTGAAGRHFYVYGDKTTVSGNFLLASGGAVQHYACILLDGNISSQGGRILAYNPAVVNVGGKGSISTNYKTAAGGGLFSFTGANLKHELNLYGGTFTNTTGDNLANPVIYATTTSSEVNIWSDDVVIGRATKPDADAAASYNAYIVGKFNMYAGTIQNGKAAADQGYQSGNLHLAAGADANIYGGTIKNGYATRGANVVVASAVTAANIYGVTIEGGYATSNGGGIYSSSSNLNIQGGTIKNNKSVYPGGGLWNGGTIEIKGALFSGNESTASHGGNIFLGSGTTTLAATTTLENGKAKGNGGNIYVNASSTLIANGPLKQDSKVVAAVNGGNACVDGGTATFNGDVTDGHTSSWGGNIAALNGGTIILGDATVSGGLNDGGGELGRNIRLAKGTLSLTGSAQVASGILLLDTADVTLNVASTFTGDVYVWRNGTGAKPGDAVKYATCDGAFTGSVRNGTWQPATGTYVPLEMVWDGAEGLKYPASTIVYNGTAKAAASAQDAVDAYIAAMADEEVTAKPQYVIVDGDVNIGDKDVVIDATKDITVTGTGVVYGVDRANDAYGATSGSITVAGGATVAAEVKAGGRRYIALSDANTAPNTYTFHRVEAKLTNVTVNVSKAGIYYKSSYNFDEVVKDRVVSYGVLVNVDADAAKDSYAGMTSSNDTTSYADTALAAASHGVFGVFKYSNNTAKNQANGQMKLYGNPYLSINTTNEDKEPSEYPVFDAASKGMSMFDAMELANTKWDQLSPEAQGFLNDFVNEWNAKGVWTTDLLEALTNFTIA